MYICSSSPVIRQQSHYGIFLFMYLSYICKKPLVVGRYIIGHKGLGLFCCFTGISNKSGKAFQSWVCLKDMKYFLILMISGLQNSQWSNTFFASVRWVFWALLPIKDSPLCWVIESLSWRTIIKLWLFPSVLENVSSQ